MGERPEFRPYTYTCIKCGVFRLLQKLNVTESCQPWPTAACVMHVVCHAMGPWARVNWHSPPAYIAKLPGCGKIDDSMSHSCQRLLFFQPAGSAVAIYPSYGSVSSGWATHDHHSTIRHTTAHTGGSCHRMLGCFRTVRSLFPDC